MKLNKNILQDPDYSPDKLLDSLIIFFDCKNNAGLADVLKTQQSKISDVRHKKIHISPFLFLRIHEISGHSIHHLRKLAGIKS